MNETAALPVASMNFEQAIEELETIVRQLEGGRVKLDEAIDAYERGAALKRHCEMKLSEAKAKVDRISVGADGALRMETQTLD